MATRRFRKPGSINRVDGEYTGEWNGRDDYEPSDVKQWKKILEYMLEIEENKDRAEHLVRFRQALMALLTRHGISTNPNWSGEDIIRAFEELLKKK